MTSTTRGPMTPRERVLAAVKGLPVDRAPVMYWLNPHMACRLLAEYRPGDGHMANALAHLLWRRYVRGGGLNAGELTRAIPLLFEQYGNGPYALELGADRAIQSSDLTSAGSCLSGVRRRGGRRQIEERLPSTAFDAPSGFHWLPFDKLELQFYNIRHIQHHVGELYERLAAAGGAEVGWAARHAVEGEERR